MNMFIGAVAGATVPTPVFAHEPPARKGPVGPDDASPELREAVRSIEPAHDAFKAAYDTHQVAWNLWGAWEKRNRMPVARRAYRKWERRADAYSAEIGLSDSLDALEDARIAYRKAQIAVANVKCRDVRECVLKSSVVFVYENMGEGYLRHHAQPIIATSVAIDICVLEIGGHFAGDTLPH